jgi:glycosyltransferase involved in cell wall biosynthesis
MVRIHPPQPAAASGSLPPARACGTIARIIVSPTTHSPSRPLVSVITPSFQQGRFLERTLESVARQGTGSLAGAVEHIVMDGGSTDGTLTILERWSDRIVFHSEPDGGQTAAINAGIAQARGEILAYLNSDDTYCDGAIAAALDAFERHPDADVVYGAAQFIDAADRVLARYPTEEFSLDRLKLFCFLCQPAVFFRREFFERVGPFDPRFDHCLDYEYWLRAALRGARFVHIPRLLASSRLHPDTKTNSLPERVHTEINQMLVERLGTVPDNWLVNFAHAVLDGRGIPRSSSITYMLHIGMLALAAAFRWNGFPQLSLLRTIGSWLLYRTAPAPASGLAELAGHV